MKYDYLVVGAGFAGSIIAERIASQLGKKVLLADRRNHIGGNAFDFYNEDHILCHKYGPHIFHTYNKKVWDYLSKFTKWRQYEHKVLAVIGNIKAPVPFNLNSLYKVFPDKKAKKYEELLLKNYGLELKIPILKLLEAQDVNLKELAEFIYNNVFYGYNLKQWDLTPEQLDYSVSSRVPVFISRDDRYFQDTYQGIPAKGYTTMFQNILSHKNIHLLLNTDFKDIETGAKYDRLVYTGNIDAYFDYLHGELPYRSLEFEFKTLGAEFFQETAQVNYPNSEKYTRITEFKHLTGQKHDLTTIAYEYSLPYLPGKNEPYYPIPRQENEGIYNLYYKEAEKLKEAVHFVGRLANYKYYNMDQIAGVALMVFEKEIAGRR